MYHNTIGRLLVNRFNHDFKPTITIKTKPLKSSDQLQTISQTDSRPIVDQTIASLADLSRVATRMKGLIALGNENDWTAERMNGWAAQGILAPVLRTATVLYNTSAGFEIKYLTLADPLLFIKGGVGGLVVGPSGIIADQVAKRLGKAAPVRETKSRGFESHLQPTPSLRLEEGNEGFDINWGSKFSSQGCESFPFEKQQKVKMWDGVTHRLDT